MRGHRATIVAVSEAALVQYMLAKIAVAAREKSMTRSLLVIED